MVDVFGTAGVKCGMGFVDIDFLEGGVSKLPSKGIAFLLVITFVLASMVELRDGASDALASLAIGKWEKRKSHKLAFLFIAVIVRGRQALAGLATRSRRELHHRLRLGRFSCTLKTPTPCQTLGRSNIAFLHILRHQ